MLGDNLKWNCFKNFISIYLPLFIFHFFYLSHNLYASEIVANTFVSKSGNDRFTSTRGCGFGNAFPCKGPTVVNENNALVLNNSFARLYASPGLVAGLGSYQGVLEIAYDHVVPANTITYVRIDAEEALLEYLLGGSLGTLLAQTVSSAVFGQQVITIEARNSSGTTVLTRSSSQGFDSNSYRLVTDENGYHYLRIQPSQAYQRIRLTNSSGALAGFGTEYTLDVYDAFYYDTEDVCDAIPTYTSYDGSGITLAALSLNDPIVNMEDAVDGDFENTYSEMSLGVVSLAGSSSEQFFYFDSPVVPGKEILVNLSSTSSLIDLGLFNNIEIVAYSEGVEVNTVTAASLLDLDLLELLEAGEFFQFPISSDSYSIDQVGVRINSVANLGIVSDVLRIAGVYVSPPTPELDEALEDNSYELCEGRSIIIQPIAESGIEYNWYSDWEGSDFLGKTETFEIPATTAPGTYVYYVRSNFSSCSYESLPAVVTVEIKESTDVETISIEPSGEATIDEEGYYVYREGVDPVILSPSNSNPGTDGSYSWYFDENQSDPISDGMERDGVIYQINADGTISMSGLGYTDPSSPYTFYLNYVNNIGCPSVNPKDITLNSILRILHIDLTSFTLKIQEENDILLKWGLAKVEDQQQIILEKSGPDLQWKSIMEGRKEEIQSMEFLDENPFPGFNFYRIKVFNPDGQLVFTSKVYSIEVDLKDELVYKAYPSYFQDELYITKNSNITSTTTYLLYSNEGILIQRGEVDWENNYKSFPITGLGHLPSGHYLLILKNEGKMQSIRLIK